MTGIIFNFIIYLIFRYNIGQVNFYAFGFPVLYCVD